MVIYNTVAHLWLKTTWGFCVKPHVANFVFPMFAYRILFVRRAARRSAMRTMRANTTTPTRSETTEHFLDRILHRELRYDTPKLMA